MRHTHASGIGPTTASDRTPHPRGVEQPLIGLQRTAGNRAVASLIVQRDWNPVKIRNSSTVPPFSADDVFAAAKTSRQMLLRTGATNKKKTKKQFWDYTFYTIYGIRMAQPDGSVWKCCLVAHTHVTAGVKGPGNVFVPGYDNWEARTPAAFVAEAPAFDASTHIDGYASNASMSTTLYTNGGRFPTFVPAPVTTPVTSSTT